MNRIFWSFLFLLLQTNVFGIDTLKIGIINDQVTDSVGRHLIDQMKKEIKDVIGSDTYVVFNTPLYNGYSLDLAKGNYMKSIQESDIIISFGLANSVMLYKEESYPKPIIIVGSTNKDLIKISSNKLTSGINNLMYLVTPFSYKDDLDAMASLYQYSKVGIVVEDFVFNLMPLKKKFDEYFLTKESDYKFIVLEDRKGDDSLFKNIDAVYFLSKNTLSNDEFEEMILQVNKEKLPSISAYGIPDVEKGVLLSNYPKNTIVHFFRRIALSVEAINDGENPSELELVMDFRKQLSINMETARIIDFPIRNSKLGVLNLIEGKSISSVESYSMVGLMKTVVGENLGLKTQRKQVELSEQDVKTAKSNYLPDLSLNANATYIDPELAKVSNGNRPELSTNGNLTLKQVIYSQQATSGVSIKKEALLSQRQVYSANELDAILNASTAYVNTLILKTNVIIHNKNLQLTRDNLTIAKENYELGASGKSDVLRFQSQISQNTKNLIFARNSLTQGYYQINQLLNHPIDESISIKDTLMNTDLMENDTYQFLIETLDDPSKSRVFTAFLIEEANRNAPEIKNISHQLNAVSTVEKLNGVGRFIPTLALQGQYNYMFSRSGYGSTFPSGFGIPPDGNYNVVVNLSLPIFQSNQRNINRQYAHIQKEQLGFQQENIELSISKNIHDVVLNIVNEIANIEISKVNLEYAKESLSLSQNEYKNGAIPVIQLIDAQNNYLNAYLENSVAKYNYMLVSMKLQREISYFFLMNSVGANQDFVQRAKDYIWSH